MIKRYKLPIQGTVLAREPLTGSEDDPIGIIPLNLPDRPTYFDEQTKREKKEGCDYICLDYNIDEEWCEVELEASEEFHIWLASMLPQLRGIQKEKGWKLDKSKMVERLG